MIFEPVNVDAQSVVKAGWLKDPLKVENVQATFFARQGKFKLKKTSEISNLPMEAVGFVVKLSNGETLELETKADGYTAESKDYDFGTIGEVTEVKTPAGYVALDKPIQFTIVAGETIEVAIENKVQKGKLIFQKFEEVYNPQETWEAGKPIYDRNPVYNREFDLVRVNDHTLPDGKTIVGKQGEVVDHIVTDKDGNGSSNLELYIGSQNKYKLVETNTPENYRDPSAVQTEFSIPYGNNTEKLVLFDQGEIDNELKTTNITFNKKNALDLSGLNLAGAEFLVQGVTNDVKFKLTTETTGSLLKVLADKGTATYTFTEVKRPDGFGQVTGDTDTRIVTVTDGQDMTIDWENMPIMPKIGTKAHGENGEKDFDPTVDNTLYDSIHYEGVEVGKEKTLVTKIVEVGTGKIIKEIEGQITFDKQAGTHVVETFIPANTIKENTKTVFLEYLYNDKEKKKNMLSMMILMTKTKRLPGQNQN
ncbi:collagen binding domain-containing protein [Enterococcus termitis]